MRKVTFGGANSLDNYIARKDDAVDWLMWSDEVTELMNEFWRKIDCIVMGRKTYDVAMKMSPPAAPTTSSAEAAATPPQAGGEPKLANPYGDMKTYVFSRTLEPGERNGVEIVSQDAGKFVRKLKKQKGKEICVMGGGELGRSLLEAGVIDEIGFNIQPVLLGSGIALFHEMTRQIDLELIECKPLKTGCVYILYRVKN
jgi:dihydrofolate reductase